MASEEPQVLQSMVSLNETGSSTTTVGVNSIPTPLSSGESSRRESSNGTPLLDSSTNPAAHHPQSTTNKDADARSRFKVHNRPAQLIRNLHASYFHRQGQQTSLSSGSNESAVDKVVQSIRGQVFVFGAVVSVAGCAVLLGQGLSGKSWHGISHSGLVTQLAYQGIFAATCSWQWLKRISLSNNCSIADIDCSSDNSSGDNSKGDITTGDRDDTNVDMRGYRVRSRSDSLISEPRPTEPMDNDSDASTSRNDGNRQCSATEHAQVPLSVCPPTSMALLPYWVFGYGLLGLFGLTPALSLNGWSSYLWSPVLILSSLSPLLAGPILLGLDMISNALSQDLNRHIAELDNLQERHDQLMEAYRDDNLLKKNLLLETVGKEVQDAATLAIETLRQMTPTSLFPPSISREQLSPCTLPIPITSVLGLFTTMRHLQYIARNMQRLSRVMFTEYVQGIVEKTSPHYHRGENSFDVGEFVQSLGDLVSADASLKGVEFVIYHAEYDLNHVPIKGSEESWRHALINLIKSIIDSAKSGSTVELCLMLFTTSQQVKKNKVMVSFEITYTPNQNSTSNEDDLAQLNALLASKLVNAMGGTLVIEQLEKWAKRFTVTIEVEISRASQEDRISHLKNVDDNRSVHPFEPNKAEDASQPAVIQDRLQRLENMQTSHPMHESQQFFQQHIKTPLGSPSTLPSSPPPRRGGSSSSFRISTEPTPHELVKFSGTLTGMRVLVVAKENSAFCVRLLGFLQAWGANFLKRTIHENSNAPGDADIGDIYTMDEPQTPIGAKRTNSSSSLSGKHSGKPDSATSTVKSLNNPAFIMIDDDVKTLSQYIFKLQTLPPSPGPSRRPTHRRYKSISSIQHTSIIYFTSLPTFKQAKDTIMSTLGNQAPGVAYSITNTPPSHLTSYGPLPYILVLPKPAGPRRILTALHTAVHMPILDQSYSPIATAPTSPAPAIPHINEEVNPLDRDQIVYDPVSNQAFARTVPHSAQSSPGGTSPNIGLPHDQRQKRDMVQQLIEAGGSLGVNANPFDHSMIEMVSPETPGSLRSMASPTGVPVHGTGSQSGGIQFDPTARTTGTLSPSLVGAGGRRVSNGGGRIQSHTISSGEGGTVVIPAGAGTMNHQPFALSPNGSSPGSVQRSAEGTAPAPSFMRLGSGQLLRPGGGRSPMGTPPAIIQSNGGLTFSPPPARATSAPSPMPQRPEAAAMIRSNNSSSTCGTMNNIGGGGDGPKVVHSHPVSPHGSTTTSSSLLPTSPGAHLPRISSGTSIMSGGHVASSSISSAVETGPGRTTGGGSGVLSGRKSKDTRGSAKVSQPSSVKSGVVERVSPLVNVLIVEDNPINQAILAKFMRQRKIKYDRACNGEEAVEKWRVGGFHLVLMDIQMPVMDGIEATRKIRELERAQKIGFFPTDKPNSVGNSMAAAAASSSTSDNALSPTALTTSTSATGVGAPTPPVVPAFRSPVIIVALTASAESEESRRTALLAGCNDYITKPIDFAWLERKIVDWGCMQALIDVHAWKEWKRDTEGISPGSPSGNRYIAGSGSGGQRSGATMGNSVQTAALKKTLANAGSVTRANLKRPSTIARSIKGSKAVAAAAVAAAAAANANASTEASASVATSKSVKSASDVSSDKKAPESSSSSSPTVDSSSTAVVAVATSLTTTFSSGSASESASASTTQVAISASASVTAPAGASDATQS
ncbi:ssk1 response regulator receiver [Mortierella polycephala]|uniref:Ssk1 response regulator receiver n=1 Tax=Mortierella polycephala TaxID=41804 RepID=A0A9P6TY83_9FUNG|nr:ssk1 response regulator receiver [Mortierella polycephala]